MADNFVLNPGVGGETLKTDELADTTHVPYTKLLDPTADSTTIVGVPGNGVNANAMRVTIASDCNWSLQAGTAAIGTVILGTGTAAIGTAILGAGSAAIGSAIVGGSVAHDASGTSILPILNGAISVNQDGSSAGLVAENDLTRIKATLDGRVLTTGSHPYYFNAHVAYGASAQTNATIQAAVASNSILITDITYANGPTAVNYVKLLDGSGGSIVESAYLAVNSTVHVSLQTHIKLTSNTLLAVTSTGASELDITVSGYYAP